MSQQHLHGIYYTDGHGQEFMITQYYTNPQDGLPWVRYENIQTEQEYTATLESFEQRFWPRPGD